MLRTELPLRGENVLFGVADELLPKLLPRLPKWLPPLRVSCPVFW